MSFEPDDHDVRPGLDPVVFGGRLGRIGIGVAGVGAAFEHVHEADVASGGGLWPIHACAHLAALASMHIGSGPGVAGLSGMQVQPLLPLRSSVILPSAPTVITDALCAIDAGAADSALLTGSAEGRVAGL